MEINKILELIHKTEKYEKYIEYKLKNQYDVKEGYIKNKVNDLNIKDNNVICLYNSRTHIVDNIGVIDINGKRYIDFDDDMFTMINKGIDVQTCELIK